MRLDVTPSFRMKLCRKKSAAVCDTLYYAECYANYCSALRFVRWMASDIAGIERMIRVMTASAPM